ncbi:MAG: alpha-mannosidase [Chloroflexi bacterium]|nr:alpha-mannosidase [Chloroflexota bacterium]
MLFFTCEKIAKLLWEIRPTVYRETLDIPWFKFHEGDVAGAEQPDFDDSGWDDFCLMDYWGGYDVTAWFRAYVPIPAGWTDHKLALRFLVGPRDGGGSTAETMLYVNGARVQAIDVWHEEAWLPPELLQTDCLVVALRSWSGVLDVPDRRRFKVAQLNRIDDGAERFYYLANTLLKAVNEVKPDDWRHVRLLEVLNEAFRLVDFTRVRSDCYYDSLHQAQQFLSEELCSLRQMEPDKPQVTAVGHSHIDLAWLWRVKDTRQKAGRTFTTVLHLMRQYPEYRFLHSSPQLYEWVKHDYPDLYRQVKEKIAAGEWEITGGMWVEPDTNLPGGESLVRQLLYGRRFIRQEFGVDTNIVWLPDVFGFSYALPQIIKKSGMKYFLTSKISWSQFNRFPYDTFRWRGLDGSEVLAHFVTTPEEGSPFYTYNGTLQPRDVKGIWEQYRSKATNDELLLLFGWGDGGGGPTAEMLESARVMQNVPGFPKVTMGGAEPFFARLDKRLTGQDVPVWDGELYLEYHRGTYTSQAYNKRANRKSEILYHDAEWMSALADELTGQQQYPDLGEGWKLILLNQFHDVLPGSSIRQVYEDSTNDYARVAEIGGTALQRAQQTVLDRIHAERDSVVVFNSLSWQRDSLIELPYTAELEGKTLADDSGQPLPMQLVEDGGRAVLLEATTIPSCGYKTYSLVEAVRAASDLSISPDRLENRYYRIELNECGQITSLFDKEHGREVLAPGARANVLQAFEDRPMAFDAWDIDLFYQEKMREIHELVSAEVEETGPLRGTLRLTWRFYDSTIVQRVTLYRSSRRIDFYTEADWHEQQILLKAAFPVDVRATRATYDIQFGNIERPTHWNTSWDWARFEVPAHKWMDLSEGNYGVALLNDCKYGCDVKENVLRLTLLKSAVRPDALADKGHHVFTYSLLPHAGDWRQANVPREAYALNVPVHAAALHAQPSGDLPLQYSLAAVNADHVVLETVKRAEDDDSWIIRVYDYKQYRNQAVSITFGRPIKSAVECDLMEMPLGEAFHEGNRLTFAIAPYEIRTYKIRFGG